MNKKQMTTDTTELAEALKKEPENIQEIILNGVNSILEEYAENCCTTPITKNSELDIDDKVEAFFSLQSLEQSSSYKLYGIRYFDFDASVSTYYGKRFCFTVRVSCSEHINDVFCTKLNGKKVIACNWLDPFKVSIEDISKHSGIKWCIDKIEPEIVEL